MKGLPYPNDNWTRVEIFRCVYGHLPTHTSDTITKKTLKQFVEGVDVKKITSSTVDVEDICNQILLGNVLTSSAMKRILEQPAKERGDASG